MHLFPSYSGPDDSVDEMMNATLDENDLVVEESSLLGEQSTVDDHAQIVVLTLGEARKVEFSPYNGDLRTKVKSKYVTSSLQLFTKL